MKNYAIISVLLFVTCSLGGLLFVTQMSLASKQSMQQLEPETTPSGGPLQSPFSPHGIHGGMPDPQGGGPVDMGMGMGGPML